MKPSNIEVEQLELKKSSKLLEPITVNGVKVDSEERIISRTGSSHSVTLPSKFLEKLSWFRGAVLEISLVEPDDPQGGVLLIRRVKGE